MQVGRGQRSNVGHNKRNHRKDEEEDDPAEVTVGDQKEEGSGEKSFLSPATLQHDTNS